MSTWIHENRVSKHFVISLNFPCLSLFTVLFAYVGCFGCFLVRDFCRSAVERISRIRVLSNLPFTPHRPSFPQNSLSNISDSYLKSVHAQIWFRCRYQFTFRYWSPWETFPGEHHVKLWDGTKLIRFIWLTIATDRPPRSGLRQKGTILLVFLRWSLSLWLREQALRSQIN